MLFNTKSSSVAGLLLIGGVVLFSCKHKQTPITETRICTALLDTSHHIDYSLEAVGNPDLFWPDNTRQLVVRFNDGDAAIQQKVIQTARKWESLCGVSLQFDNAKKPDITVSFNGVGSWSYIGTDSRKHNPSMNFGWFDKDTPDTEYDRVVLHEFGHALGLYHECQNDNNNPLMWNKMEVYRYYKGPPNKWSPAEVDQNIFRRYDFGERNGTAYDPLSIMMYEIPQRFLVSGTSAKAVSKFSDMDRKFIAAIYPKR